MSRFYKFYIFLFFLTCCFTSVLGQQWVLKFDPASGNSYVDCGPSNQYALNAFTIETWIYLDTPPDNYDCVLASESYDNANGAMGFALRFNENGKLELSVGTGNWESVMSGANAIKVNQWQHIAASVSTTGAVKLFVDGNEVGNGTLSNTMVTSITNLYMGEGSMWQGRGLDGKLTDLRIWNVARTSTDIKSDMNKTLTGQEAGLLANWPLDEGNGDALADVTGTYNVTKGAGTYWVEKVNIVVSGSLKVLAPGKDSVLLTVPDQTIDQWEISGASGQQNAVFSIVDDYSAYLVYQSSATSYSSETLMVSATSSGGTVYQNSIVAESYNNKYQYFGEVLIDKIHREFYNKSNSLYAEEINSSLQFVQATSFLWPASHMLRALKNAWTLNPQKYEAAFISYINALETYRTTVGGATGYAVLPFGNERYYDDNGLLVIQYADIYDRMEDNGVLEKLKTAYKFNNDIHDSNMGIPQHEEQLGEGMFYSMAVNQTSYGAAKLYQITNESKYWDEALAYYSQQNDYAVKLKNASTQLFNQYSFYQNGSWSLSGSINGVPMNGGGYRAYQTTVVVQNAIVLYQITNEDKYINDAKQMMDASLNHWYTPGSGLREISFWGGNDMIDALLELYAETEEEKYYAAAADIVDFLIENGRDKRGYYAGSYSDAQGAWNLYRTNLNPSNVMLMAQAAAASAFLHVASYATDIISAIDAPILEIKTKNELKVYPNPAAPGELLNISMVGNREISQIKIYNQMGQELDCVAGTEVFDGRFRLINKLETGIYIVQVMAGSESFQTKLILK